MAWLKNKPLIRNLVDLARLLIGKFIHQGPAKLVCIKMRPLLAAYLIRDNGFKLCTLIVIAQDLHFLAGASPGEYEHDNLSEAPYMPSTVTCVIGVHNSQRISLQEGSAWY